MFDFKAVFEDGQELVRNGIDVCTTSHIYLHGRLRYASQTHVPCFLTLTRHSAIGQ